MDPLTLDAIKNVGMPVVSLIAVGSFLSMLIKWIITWFANRLDVVYKDYKDSVTSLVGDVNTTMQAHTSAIKDITQAFQETSNKMHEYIIETRNESRGFRREILDNINQLKYDKAQDREAPYTKKLSKGKKRKGK